MELNHMCVKNDMFYQEGMTFISDVQWMLRDFNC